MTKKEILKKLESLGDPRAVEGMAKFGITGKKVYGVSIPNLRKIAKEIGKDHQLAEKLWNSEIHEARLLASFVDIPEKVTEEQMNSWVADFDSWDICDQVCSNLFDKTPYVHKKILEWVKDEREFVRRASFVLIASSSVHNKEWPDKNFERYFPLIKKYSTDERNFVRKAINWALRQIGKRNLDLNKKAIQAAKEIQEIDSKSSKWISSDAFRELTTERVQKRLRR